MTRELSSGSRTGCPRTFSRRRRRGFERGPYTSALRSWFDPGRFGRSAPAPVVRGLIGLRGRLSLRAPRHQPDGTYQPVELRRRSTGDVTHDDADPARPDGYHADPGAGQRRARRRHDGGRLARPPRRPIRGGDRRSRIGRPARVDQSRRDDGECGHDPAGDAHHQRASRLHHDWATKRPPGGRRHCG